MSQITKLLLRDTYAQITKNGVINNNDLFKKGNDIFHYLKYNKQKINNNDIIVFYHPNIINLYWLSRELLNPKELSDLKFYIREPSPTFEILEQGGYSFTGDINNYRAIYVKVKDFINFVNDNRPIISEMSMLSKNINLEYELYDFYNFDINQIDNHM